MAMVTAPFSTPTLPHVRPTRPPVSSPSVAAKRRLCYKTRYNTQGGGGSSSSGEGLQFPYLRTIVDNETAESCPYKFGYFLGLKNMLRCKD
jgi:hypothetical protein